MTAFVLVLAVAAAVGAVWTMFDAERRRRKREYEIMRRMAEYAWRSDWGTVWGCIGWMAAQEFMSYAVMGGLLASYPDFARCVAEMSGTWGRVIHARDALREGLERIAAQARPGSWPS